MEKASLFNELSKYLIGPSLAALLTAAPVWADGMWSEGNDTNVTDPQPDSARTTELPDVTLDDLDRKFKQLSDEIKSIGEAQSKEQLKEIKSLGEAQSKEQLGKIKEKIDEAIPPKAKKHVFFEGTRFEWEISDEEKDFALDMVDIVGLVLAIIAMWKASKYNIGQGKVVKEQKAKLDASTKKSETANYKIRLNLARQAAMTQANRTIDTLKDDVNSNRDERIGDFPEMYHYIVQRIQHAKNIVVITMPFYQFGVLRSPDGLIDFHHTLAKVFKNAANQPELVFITYDDENRYRMARKRYSTAFHAMETLDDTAQSKRLKDIYRQDVWKKLTRRLDVFRERLNRHEDSREILAQLAEKQSEKYDTKRGPKKDDVKEEIARYVKQYKEKSGRTISDEAAIDKMFIRYLRESIPQRGDYLVLMKKIFDRYVLQKKFRGDEPLFSVANKKLFSSLDKARSAFSRAVERQEKIYFGEESWDNTGTPWPVGAEIIKLSRDQLKSDPAKQMPDRTFDNEMTVCIDGVEVIRAYSSLIADDESRQNELETESGIEAIESYNNQLKELFKTAGQQKILGSIMEKLKKARSQAHKPPQPETGPEV